MKKFLLAFSASSLLLTANAIAHDLKYTLIQDGAVQVATCAGKSLGTTQVDLYKTKNSRVGYLVLSNADEDSGTVSEHIVQTNVSGSGHDVEVYNGVEIAAELVVVGEGTTPLRLTFRHGPSALKVWLKTYGQGFNLNNAKLECTLL